MGSRSIAVLVAAGCLAVAAVSGVCVAAVRSGAESITLYGGSTGNVPFPHRQHQATVGDCAVCHSVFAQTAGAIDEMKAAGTLKKKQVMNKQCIQCHRQKKQNGENSGPTTCRSCHFKS